MAEYVSGEELSAIRLNKNRAFLSGIKVVNSGGQAFPQASATIVEFDNEWYDLGSEFDPATYKFTANKDGYYSVQGGLGISNGATASAFQVRIIKNAGQMSNFHFQFTSTAKLMSVPFMDTIVLSAGDTIEIRVYVTSSSSFVMSGGIGTHLEIRMIYEL